MWPRPVFCRARDRPTRLPSRQLVKPSVTASSRNVWLGKWRSKRDPFFICFFFFLQDAKLIILSSTFTLCFKFLVWGLALSLSTHLFISVSESISTHGVSSTSWGRYLLRRYTTKLLNKYKSQYNKRKFPYDRIGFGRWVLKDFLLPLFTYVFNSHLDDPWCLLGTGFPPPQTPKMIKKRRRRRKKTDQTISGFSDLQAMIDFIGGNSRVHENHMIRSPSHLTDRTCRQRASAPFVFHFILLPFLFLLEIRTYRSTASNSTYGFVSRQINDGTLRGWIDREERRRHRPMKPIQLA